MHNKIITQSINLEFDEVKHEYKVDGKTIPSVSRLLESITYEIYGNIPKYILEEAQERGSEVHRMVELKWKFPNVTFPLSQVAKGYVEQFELWQKENPHMKILGMEIRIYNRILGYCGTLDIIALNTLTNEIALIDIKTNQKLNKLLVALQQTLYLQGMMVHFRDNETKYLPRKIYVLHLQEDSYNFEELKIDMEGAQKCIEFYKFKKKILEGNDLVERINKHSH